mmetsp:Transcript_26202/g.25804  ORF Transcript_26202/g.25804 Transcript_26202/m.25804 type:complete len:97 (-) Transcript_26202:211-501(-)
MHGIDRILITNGIKFDKKSEFLLVTFKMLKHNLSRPFAKISDCPCAFEEMRVTFLTSLMTSVQLIEELTKFSAFVDNQKDLKNKIIEDTKLNIILE